MNAPLGIVLVGAGAIARTHVNAILASPHVALRAVHRIAHERDVVAIDLQRRHGDVAVDDLGCAGGDRKHQHKTKRAQRAEQMAVTSHAEVIGWRARFRYRSTGLVQKEDAGGFGCSSYPARR